MKCIDIKRGLNIHPDIAAGATTDAAPSRSVALLGMDYPGIKPSLVVAQGDHVSLGEALFTDRTDRRIRCVAPATGIVSAIHFGPRHSLQALVIELTNDADQAPVVLPGNGAIDAATVRAILLENGMWPALRERPHDVIPNPDTSVAGLFVTAIDTRPLALDPAPIIRRNAQAFATGVEKLSLLAEHTYVCVASGSALSYPESPNVTSVAFNGPHPAGLPGTHIHHVAPSATQAWHIGYQDVIAVGHLFLNARLSVSREISLAGPGLDQARHLQTRIGAALADLTTDALPGCITTSGSPLCQHRDSLVGSYLGRHHNQAWISAPVPQTPAKIATLKSWFRQLSAPRTTASRRGNSTLTGMLTVEAFDDVWPFKMPVTPLLRALLTCDTATANELGATMLTEEDLALCSYVCPAKQDYGAALSATLRAFAQED